MRDPQKYCPSCDSRFSFSDESCRHCGFDPLNNADDEIAYDKALRDYNREQNSANS